MTKIQKFILAFDILLFIFLSVLLCYNEFSHNKIKLKKSDIPFKSNYILTSSGEENFYKIDINSASIDDLKEVKGIGDVIAKRIIDYRNKIGGFKNIDQLMNVEGIGVKKFNTIKQNLAIGGK